MQLLAGGLCNFFYNILDLAAINAQILDKLVTGPKISRRKYLLRLRFVEKRKANSHQSNQTNSSMQKSQKRKHCQSKSCINKTRETWSCSSYLFCGKCIGKQEKSFIVVFAANKYWSWCVLSYFLVAMHAIKLCQNFSNLSHLEIKPKSDLFIKWMPHVHWVYDWIN